MGSGCRWAVSSPSGNGTSARRPFRVDGRLVIAGMLAIAFLFVGLNLLLAHGGPVRTFTDPASRPARPGVAYRVRLLPPCAPAIDFSGQYWAPSGGRTLEPPAEPATATLVSADRVVLVTGAGQRFRLVPRGRAIRLS